MDDGQYHRLVLEAAQGLHALNNFIETRFTLADKLEADGDQAEAEACRAVWTEVWSTLADAPQRSIAAELHDLMAPPVPDEALSLA